MDFYIIQWCNIQNPNDIGAECFADEGEAELYLEKIVRERNGDDTDYDICCETSQILYPYVYKVTRRKMEISFK